MRKSMSLSLALTGALLLTACGKKPGSYETLAEEGGKAATNMNKSDDARLAQADELWQQRADQAKLEEAIKVYEGLATAMPQSRLAHERAARGWYFLADGFTEDKDVQIERYLKAIEWGKRCMAINEQFATQIQDGAKEADAAAVLTKADVPCTYWTASALGKWAKASGIAKSLRHIGTVKAYIGKVEELEPTYYHHGPYRYWGAYYSVLPSFAGRDLEKSAEYFEKTMAGSPGYLGSYVLRAENLAVANQDVKQFDADLKTVLEFDLDTVPELKPENSREVLKAKKLMTEREEKFDKKALEAAGE